MNKKGFSLIEVLVTVGLIGILVSIALPSYNKYKENTLSMAVKADIANGHKAYSAFNAAEGDFCASLGDAGITVLMSSVTYRKGGFYGFGAVNADCGGTPKQEENTTFVANKGYCKKADGTSVDSINTMAACTAAMHSWETVNEFQGTTTACVLGADEFDLGAYTGTSALNTFFMVNEAGKVHSVQYATGGSSAICVAVP